MGDPGVLVVEVKSVGAVEVSMSAMVVGVRNEGGICSVTG